MGLVAPASRRRFSFWSRQASPGSHRFTTRISITECPFIFALTFLNDRLLSLSSRPEVSHGNSPSAYRPPNLKDRVALVAGATRGLGRGIALALGEAGATVYCTGRSTAPIASLASPKKKSRHFDHARRPETIDETAALVTARGGKGIAVVADHTDPFK